MFQVKTTLLFLFTLHELSIFCNSQISHENEFSEVLNLITDKLRDSEKLVELVSSNFKIQSMLGNDFKSSVFNLLPLLEKKFSKKANVSNAQCLKDLTFMVVNSLFGENWALSMLDSSGKLGRGILKGNLRWTGYYTQCQRIKVKKNITNEDIHEISGRYCWSNFEINDIVKKIAKVPPVSFPIIFRIDVCVPDSCSADDIKSILKNLSKWSELNNLIFLKEVSCLSNDYNLWNNETLPLFFIVGVISVMLILGTLYDVFYYRKKLNSSYTYYSLNKVSSKINDTKLSNKSLDIFDKEKLEEDEIPNDDELKAVSPELKLGICARFLLCFSVYTNGAKILNLTTRSENLRCLNGIRFLSMLWIILGHTCLFIVSSVDNPLFTLDVKDLFLFQLVLNTTIAVDSFFVISGFLLAYLFCKHYEDKGGKISWLKFYIYRYWRLTPVYLLVILSITTTNNYFMNNAIFSKFFSLGYNCVKNWWWNALYINNFLELKDMCMGNSWYLANDMQFYILSPLILIPMVKKWGVYIFISAGAFLLTSIISTIVIAYYYNASTAIDMFAMNANSNEMHIFDVLYDKPYCRIGVYIVGLLCGWLLYKTTNKFEMKKHWVIIGWILTFVCNYTAVFGLYRANLSRIAHSFYLEFSRVFWSLGLCWLIFACCTGYGGIINSFLSWPIWIPLSRLTYCVYLIQTPVIILIFQMSEVLIHFSFITLAVYYLGIVVICYILAVIYSLAFEAPFIAMEGRLLNWRS